MQFRAKNLLNKDTNVSRDNISNLGSAFGGSSYFNPVGGLPSVAPGGTALTTYGGRANYPNAPGSAINTVERVVSAFPQPKKGTLAFKKKEAEAAERAK